MSAPRFEGEGLVSRTLRVARAEVAYVRYLLEAHDGLASLHVADGGRLTFITTREQVEALDAFLRDLTREVVTEPWRAEPDPDATLGGVT